MTQDTAIEIWESPDGDARFCFTHSDEHFTTGVLILKPSGELPKHNRPLAVENLLQVAGESTVTLYDDNDVIQSVHELGPGNSLQIPQGTWHVHSNPTEDESVTLFKAVGDISEIVAEVRKTFSRIQLMNSEPTT